MIETRKDAASEQPEKTSGPIVRCPECGEKLTCVVFEDGAWQVPTCQVEAARWEKARHDKKDDGGMDEAAYTQMREQEKAASSSNETRAWEDAALQDAYANESPPASQADLDALRETLLTAMVANHEAQERSFAELAKNVDELRKGIVDQFLQMIGRRCEETAHKRAQGACKKAKEISDEAEV